MANILVAKSYQGLPFLCDPYQIGSKTYVKIRTKSGEAKQVKVYTPAEYKAYYHEDAPSDSKQISIRRLLGFGEAGYITIFKGDTYKNIDFFKREKACRYHRVWGWYVVSTEEVPSPLPVEIEPVHLKWEDISDGENLLPDEKIKPVIDSLIYDKGTSEYVGKIGERLTLSLLLVRAVDLNNDYGHSFLYIFEDETANRNRFVWITASKILEEGRRYEMKATIKKHELYKNTKTTYLSRCAEVKK